MIIDLHPTGESWSIQSNGEELGTISGTIEQPVLELNESFKYFDIVTYGSNFGCVIVNDYIGKLYPEEYHEFENEQEKVFNISKEIINNMDMLFS